MKVAPFLQYWITAFFMYIFGENEFAVRLFPALCALGGIYLTGYLPPGYVFVVKNIVP